MVPGKAMTGFGNTNIVIPARIDGKKVVALDSTFQRAKVCMGFYGYKNRKHKIPTGSKRYFPRVYGFCIPEICISSEKCKRFL